MIFETGQKGSAMVELPPLSLYSMSKPQLEEFIPKLIHLASSRTPPTNPSPPATTYFKPEWWPVDVAWVTPGEEDQQNLCKQLTCGDNFESADKLRSVVAACYEYLGHKDLLNKSNMEPNFNTLKADIEVMAVDSSSDDDSEPEVVDVYVCFYCDRWFGGKDGKIRLEEHVVTHRNTSSNQPPPPPLPPLLSTSSPSFSPLREVSVSPVVKPETLEWRPRPFVPRPPRRRQEVPLWKRSDLPCNNGVNETEFLKSFGLVSSKQAKNVSKAKVDVDIDCEIIAVEGLDSRPLTSPRTPRTLMSQLSRDSEGSSKKRLSFSLPNDVGDREAAETSPSKNIQGALLNVPFSSLLGKRVKKHIKPDNSACTIKDPEEFCQTRQLRNEFLDKLRFRANEYPVTFKKKKNKNSEKFTHEYKFNKEQTVEFLKKVRTGLNKEGRRLKRKMIKCKVVLKRLSKEEINFWKEKKYRRGAEWIDDEISIVHIEPAPVALDRSRLCLAGTSGIIHQPVPPMPTPYHHPSILQARNPYLTAQMTGRPVHQFSSKPMPQFLVKKVEKQFNGHQSSKLVYVPISDLQTGPQKRIEARSKTWREQSVVVDRRQLVQNSMSRRKQHFVNVRRDDDDVSIHSQSSDDDDDNDSNNESKLPDLDLNVNYRSGNVPSPKHMVMSATGEFVKTVKKETARKSFGSAASNRRHFTSHPPQTTCSSPLTIKTQPAKEPLSIVTRTEPARDQLGEPVVTISVKSVFQSEAAKTRTLLPSDIQTGADMSSQPVSVKPVYQSETAKMRNTASSERANSSPHSVKPPTSVFSSQPVLRVVDDVIYIDDDDD